MDLLDRMLGHDRWTTSRLLEMSQRLSGEQLDQRFDIGLETVRTTLEHMIANVEFWTRLMIGEPLDQDRSDKSILALVLRHEQSYDHFASVSRQMQDKGRLTERFIDEYQVSQEVGATIIHVVVHNHQHRSEVLHMLARLGVEHLPDGDPQEWEQLSQAAR